MSVTDDPLVIKYLTSNFFPIQKAEELEGLGHLSLIFFEAVFFVLSTVGNDTPNVEQIQQLFSDEHLFWK